VTYFFDLKADGFEPPIISPLMNVKHYSREFLPFFMLFYFEKELKKKT
jgi:hypothetical protein